MLHGLAPASRPSSGPVQADQFASPSCSFES